MHNRLFQQRRLETNKILTPLLRDVIATMGLQVFVCGLYLSAEDNSMQSSRPPTA